MKLSVLKTIQREELSKFGDLPDWINPFLQVLNQFIGNVGNALKGNLTFADNFSCRVKTLTFTSAVAQEINPDTKQRVIGVFPIDSNGLVIDQFGWSRKNNGSISVTFKFGAGTSAICTVIILLG